MDSELRPADRAQTRRALLAAAAGGFLAAVAGALGRPAPAEAVHLQGFGHPNNAGAANTTLTTSSSGTALLVTQNGSGTALRGSAVGAGSIAGFFTAQNGTGISGVTGTNTKYGVYGGNDGVGSVGGAAIRADGKENHGLVATTVSRFADAVRGINSSGREGAGVYGECVAGVGVVGSTTDGYGVFGTASGPSGRGVVGSSDEGFGVVGESFGGGVGVQGRTLNTTGVAGEATGSTGYGVQGLNSSTMGGTGVGGFALATTGVPYGVYGSAPGNGYAGYFVGNAHVLGTLSKAAGSFKIDHPLDPANRYLSHSFVESPDMLNVYTGNATTDADGNAVVELPDWFDALNRDFRYQLTVIGQPAQAFVAAEIKDRRFTVATDRPDVKVSWLVTGIRRDPYAEAHRIPVDEPKPARERGTYLHPDEHGQPGSKGLDAQRAAPEPSPRDRPPFDRDAHLPALDESPIVAPSG